MTQRPVIQCLFIALTCWMLLQLVIRFLGIPVAIMIVLLVGLIACTVYGLRFEPRRMASIRNHSVGKYWIRLVCKISKQQEVPPENPLEGINLKTSEDFEWLQQRLQEEVFGHGDALEAIAAELEKNTLLRARSESKEDLPPLGVLLLAGPRGVGKRHLANCISRRLFEQPAVSVIDLRHCPDGEAAIGYLFGTPGREGALVKPVRMAPFHTIVVENFELAGTRLQEALIGLLTAGRCVDGARGGIVSFEKCLIVLTTTAVPEGLVSAEPIEREKLIAALNDKTGCPADLLDSAPVCAVLHPADDLVKAQVIVQLMIDECRRYRLNLDYVEPEVVAREVEYFSEASGFEYSRIRIARWISDPIHIAVQHGMESLVLTADLIDQDTSVTPTPTSPRPGRQHTAVLTENLTS